MNFVLERAALVEKLAQRFMVGVIARGALATPSVRVEGKTEWVAQTEGEQMAEAYRLAERWVSQLNREKA